MATAAGGTLASPSQPYDAPASPPQDLQAALAQSASSGQTALVRELLHKGANVDCPDAQGLTPCMLAVLGGHLDTAVQIALSGADLKRRDARGRTALELAVLASHREAALALVLIATNKFTRPLAPLLPGATLLRLHHWVLDRTGKNSKAAAVVAQQHVKWLTDADGATPSHEDSVQSMQGLISTLLWSTRHGHTSLREQVAHYFSAEAPKGAYLTKLVDATGSDGNTVLHALVMAGQGQAARDVVLALPRDEAMTLLLKRNHAGMMATELVGAEAPPEQRAAVALAAQDLARLAAQLSPQQPPSAPSTAASVPLEAVAPSAAASASGRGGAVRRRKPIDSSGSREYLPSVSTASASASNLSRSSSHNTGMDVEEEGDTSDGQSKAAASDLLQLAAAASSVGGGSFRPRQRDSKPYQRRGGGRGRGAKESDRDRDCWLPGGFWWQDGRTPMPSGRQPGELAGWQPLAGHATQQRLQDQQTALSSKEHFVQGLGSRDDAAAYLQQLGRGQPGASADPAVNQAGRRPSADDAMVQVPHDPARALLRSADDSEIDRVSEYKNLASWGGFRQHYIDQNKSGGAGAEGEAAAGGQPADPKREEWRLRIQEQLLQKRAEIAAAQRKLECLSLEQQELEKLYTSST